MVASDIHGSAFYCRKLMEAFEAEKPDKLLLLGDLLYHGPRNDLPKEYNPKEVITMLNGIKDKLLCVRGNCDTEVDQMVLEFPILAEYCLLYINGITIFATHGHIYNKEHLPYLQENDILLHGHTHVPVMEPLTKGWYINPGSVSIPKENSNHSYLVIEDEFLFKQLDGTIYKRQKCNR